MRAARRIVRGFPRLRICGSHLFDMARDFDAEPMRCGTPWFVIVHLLRMADEGTAWEYE